MSGRSVVAIATVIGVIPKSLCRWRKMAALETSLATVYNREAGKYDPRVSQLRSMARVFGVSMDEIDFEGVGTAEGRNHGRGPAK